MLSTNFYPAISQLVALPQNRAEPGTMLANIFACFPQDDVLKVLKPAVLAQDKVFIQEACELLHLTIPVVNLRGQKARLSHQFLDGRPHPTCCRGDFWVVHGSANRRPYLFDLKKTV